MTTYNANFSNGAVANPATWNEILTFSAAYTQTLLDDTGTDNGVSIEITTAYSGNTASSSWADNDLHDFPVNVWRSAFYAGASLGAFDIKGLPVGASYTLKLIGNSNNATRDTDFTVAAVTKLYDNVASTTNMTPPVEFTGTVAAGGIISVDQDIVSLFSYCNGFILDVVIAAGPTITGPDTTTEGSVTVQTGTLQDTVVTQSLVSGSYSIEQTIDSATAGTLTYNAESGVNQCTPSTPVSGVPLEPTITAAGITPYVVQQEADDGTNPPATRNITLNPEATHEVIQTMAGVANTTPDQSIFGSTWVTVEDNHQARLPKVVDGVTFTWNDKGEFTTDIDKTVTFQYELFSPASGNWSAISLTVKDTSIIDSGEKKRKNKRQSQVYQYYLNKNWKEKFQGSE